MNAVGQFLQALLLRVLPALVALGCFDLFKNFEPTPEYKSAGAYLLLAGVWLCNGPAWRTGTRGVRWRAWLHALVFGVIMVGSGELFFLILHAHWAGLWILLLGIATLALGPDEPKPAGATAPATIIASTVTSDVAPPPAAPKSGHQRSLVVIIAVIALVALAGLNNFRRTRQPIVGPEPIPADAAYELAWRYREGDGVPQDFVAAANWFQSAADRGLAEAHYDLGVLRENGLGLPANLEWARYSYEQAAQQNYAPALTRLGMLALADGDWPAAVAQLENAARLGDPWAEYGLGSAHLGHRAEAEGSIVDALVWLELARRHGVEPVKGLLQHVWATVPEEDFARATHDVFQRVEALDRVSGTISPDR